MNYASLIKYIKDVAINNPLVKQTIDGDIYQINSKENQYGIFCVTGDVAIRNDHTTTYDFNLFYVDRLLEDQSNKNVVQTDGIICIQSICNFINQNNENINISTPINYQLFTQHFTDQCAGVWATISMEVEDSLGDCDLFYEGLLLDPTGATSGTSILDNYYTKIEIEDLIADVEAGITNNYYTKTESDNKYETIENVNLLEDIVSGHTTNISNLQSDKADKATTLSGYGITDAYNKTEIDNKISAVFRYKGSVPTYVDLIALTGMVVGDVYNVTKTGDNYAWTGSEWDKLAGEVDLSAYLTIDSASNTYETIENVNLLSNIVSGHTEDIEYLYTNKADNATTLSGYGITDAVTQTDILYDDLLALINNNELIPSSNYRITDYITTTVQADTQSAGHNFDIIVTALSTNELSEYAKCVRKDSDTYFTNAKLEAWEIKYCIDNDTSIFAWADTVNGKGVIYYMKDEWNNECAYDFKNIQFIRKLTDGYLDEDNGVSIYVYTFTWFDNNNNVKDLSLIGNELTNDEGYKSGIFNNTIKETTSFSVYFERNTPLFVLGDNVFLYHHSYDWGLFYGCFNNSLGVNCRSNTFGDTCYSNKFGDSCYSNTFINKFTFNTFGNYCYNNTFDSGCGYNTFGDNCGYNTFGNACSYNTFGNECRSNTFSDGCVNNTFGNSCGGNTFGVNGIYNTFGNSCGGNTFGNNYYYNTFGNYCSTNNFYHGTSGTTKKDYIKYIVLEDGCIFNHFYSTLTTSDNNYLQRIRIKGLENTTHTPTGIQITLSQTNTIYEWVIASNSSGVIKQYCTEDLV